MFNTLADGTANSVEERPGFEIATVWDRLAAGAAIAAALALMEDKLV